MSATYLFDSDNLYQKGLDPVVVEPLTLLCHNVTPAGANLLGGQQWEFQIVGRDEWYRTSYAWALLLNTEENLKLVRERNQLRVNADMARKRADLAHKKIVTIKDAHDR